MLRYLVGIILIASVIAIVTGMGGSDSGSGIYVYVGGNRVGTILDGCEMREFNTYLKLPAGSSLEIKEEGYGTAYITYLAIMRFNGRGARQTLKREEFLLHASFASLRYVRYLRFKKGEAMTFRHKIQEGDYLKAIGWYEPSK